MANRFKNLISLFGIMFLLAACTATATRMSPTTTETGVEQAVIPSVTADNKAAPTSAVPDVQATEITTSQASLVPLKDTLTGLQPQDVFQNFYDITQIPRPSGHMDKIREFLVNFGQDLELETIVDAAGNVIIHRPATAGYEDRQGVVLQAHMDMVPDKDSDVVIDFPTEPIQAFVSGDYIVTQGTTLGADNGIGIAMIMAVLQSKTLQAGPLEVLFTVDEESTMSGASGLAGDVLQGRILINLDSEEEGVFTIGSAGGAQGRVNASYTPLPAPADMTAYQVKVEGLQGGHSGVDINLGRGHATKLLIRLLKGAAETFDLHLASLSGGTVGNAIPREAAALVFLPVAQVEAFDAYIQDYEATIKAELSAVEPELVVQMEAVEPPAQVLDEDLQNILINALYGTPQGVMRMSDAIPGLVETSTNLGIVNIADGQIEVFCYLRSSVDSELQDVAQMIASVWELAGYQFEIAEPYSAWTPDPDSPILGLMQTTYQELFGKEATVYAVHAGLETGTFGVTYPDMDMISIGPTMEDVHSPSERLYIPSVEKVMNFLIEVLQRIPAK